MSCVGRTLGTASAGDTLVTTQLPSLEFRGVIRVSGLKLTTRIEHTSS